MIAHVVLFQPKGELSADGRRQVLAGIAQVVERCSSVRTCRVGRRVRHGLPGYEQTMTRDYSYALVLEFDDVSGLREYLVHRSVYHHKEADPHALVIPRLQGQAKASLVAVEFDEYGGGRFTRMHSRLYADLMDEVGLDNGYLRYLDVVPAVMLATVNMMSLFGLHRALRGAMVGHFAAAEVTTLNVEPGG